MNKTQSCFQRTSSLEGESDTQTDHWSSAQEAKPKMNSASTEVARGKMNLRQSFIHSLTHSPGWHCTWEVSGNTMFPFISTLLRAIRNKCKSRNEASNACKHKQTDKWEKWPNKHCNLEMRWSRLVPPPTIFTSARPQKKVTSLFHLETQPTLLTPTRGMARDNGSSARPGGGLASKMAGGPGGQKYWVMSLGNGSPAESRCLLSRIIGKGALGTAQPPLQSHKLR